MSGLVEFMKYIRFSSLYSFSSLVVLSAVTLGVGSVFCGPAHAQEDNPFGVGAADSGSALPGGNEASGVSGKPGEGKDPFSFNDEGLGLEKSTEEIEGDFRKSAFDQALKELLPLGPAEIRELLERFDRTKESTQLPVYPYPRPESIVQNVVLDPGAPPLVVKLSFGYVTTLSILDSSGSPWPIDDMSWVGDFQIMHESPEERTNLIRISPESEFAHGNISIRLAGLSAPVVMTFETNRDVVYYRMDAVIPGNGPNASVPLIDPGIKLSAGDPDMSVALSGVVPDGARKLNVSGVDGRTSAYIYNGLTYVRTPLTLLSPAWDSSVSSADGTKIYALEETPVVLLSDKGRMVRARLSPVEELINE